MESHCHLLTLQTQSSNAQIQAATQAANDAITQAQQASQLHLAAQTQIDELTSQLTQTQSKLEQTKQEPQVTAAASGAQIVRPNDVSGLTAAVSSLSAPDCAINETLQQLRSVTGSTAAQAGVGSLMKAVGDVTALTRTSMDLMEKLLTPCMPVRVLRWAMSQSDKFYADPNGLWASLLKQECGVTPQQMVALDELRAAFKTAASKQQCSLSTLYTASPATTDPAADTQQLLASLLQSHRSQVDSNQECFRSFSTILSGEQMMKFLSWVDRYGSVVVRINV